MRYGLLACLTIAVVLLAPVTARAETVGGALLDEAGDSVGGSGTDIEKASWTFDSEAGRLAVSVTFVARPTEDDWGAINALARQDSCDGLDWARLRGSNLSTEATASVGTAADGPQPDGSTGPSIAPATNVKGDDGRHTEMGVTHARLVGRSAACLTITISHNGVKDALTIPRDSTELGGPPPGTVDPGDATAGPADPAAVRLTAKRRLRFAKGAARVTIAGVAEGMTGRLYVVLQSGRIIASGRYSATSDDPIRVRLALNRRGRRFLPRHASFRADLAIVSTLGTATRERRYTVRVKRAS